MIIKGKEHALGARLKRLVLNALHRELCQVRFIKADGTKRVMLCSLMPTFLPDETYSGPSYETMVKRMNNPYLITVWDVEKMEWRAFTLERFLRLTTL
jgi:hypothetical protein